MRPYEKNYFTFYGSFRKSIDKFQTDADKVKAYSIITDYGLYGIIPQFESVLWEAWFEPIKYLIDSQMSKRASAKANGSKGGKVKNENRIKNSTSLYQNVPNVPNVPTVPNRKELNRNEMNRNELKGNNNKLSSCNTDTVIYKLLLAKPKGSYKNITSKDIQYYQELYPNVNISQEFRNIIGWFNANPSKMKQFSEIDNFINHWFRKEQGKKNEPVSGSEFKMSLTSLQNMKGKFKQ